MLASVPRWDTSPVSPTWLLKGTLEPRAAAAPTATPSPLPLARLSSLPSLSSQFPAPSACPASPRLLVPGSAFERLDLRAADGGWEGRGKGPSAPGRLSVGEVGPGRRPQNRD